MPSGVTDTLQPFFPDSRLHFSDVPGPGFEDNPLSVWSGTLPLSICVAATCLLVMLALPRLFKILPFLLGGMVRWKEAQHLADSPKLRTDCNVAALCLTFPIIFSLARFCLHPRCEALQPWQALLTTAIILGGYIILRSLIRLIARPRKSSHTATDSYKFAAVVPVMFYVLGGILLILTGLFGLALHADYGLIRRIMYWEIGVCYGLCIIRRFQIFMYYRSFFTGFLYLCTLEIVPTGALMLSAIL